MIQRNIHGCGKRCITVWANGSETDWDSTTVDMMTGVDFAIENDHAQDSSEPHHDPHDAVENGSWIADDPCKA